MKNLFINFVFYISVFFAVSLVSVHAGSLSFDPEKTATKANEAFTVSVKIDAGTDQIAGTDIYITYDDSLLSLQSVTGAGYFPLVSNIPSKNRIYISGVVANQGEFKTGTGTVATLVFKGLSEATTDIKFDCDLTKTDTSKVVKNDINASNVINCSVLKAHTVTIGAGSKPTGDTSANDEPDEDLPESGAYDKVIEYSVYGGALLLIGLALRFALRM